MSYRESFFERIGVSSADGIKATAWAMPVAALAGFVALGSTRHLGGFASAMIGLCTSLVFFLFIAGGALLVAHGAGVATQKVMDPSGSSTPSVADYSYEKALVIRGELDRALHSYERHIAERPERPAPRLLAADLYARRGDPARAETLLGEARALPGATEAERLHATNRLIDLYLGPLDRTDLARGELRFLIQAFPASQAATHARSALRSLGD